MACCVSESYVAPNGDEILVVYDPSTETTNYLNVNSGADWVADEGGNPADLEKYLGESCDLASFTENVPNLAGPVFTHATHPGTVSQIWQSSVFSWTNNDVLNRDVVATIQTNYERFLFFAEPGIWGQWVFGLRINGGPRVAMTYQPFNTNDGTSRQLFGVHGAAGFDQNQLVTAGATVTAQMIIELQLTAASADPTAEVEPIGLQPLTFELNARTCSGPAFP